MMKSSTLLLTSRIWFSAKLHKMIENAIYGGVEETYLGTELKFRAENNRSEDIEITVDTLIINGYDVY